MELLSGFGKRLSQELVGRKATDTRRRVSLSRPFLGLAPVGPKTRIRSIASPNREPLRAVGLVPHEGLGDQQGSGYRYPNDGKETGSNLLEVESLKELVDLWMMHPTRKGVACG